MHIDAVLTPAEIALLPQRDLSGDDLRRLRRAARDFVDDHGAGARRGGDSSGLHDRGGARAQGAAAGRGARRRAAWRPDRRIRRRQFAARVPRGVRGRTIITTTTNGTIALRACERRGAGARRRVAESRGAGRGIARASAPSSVLLVCAGTFETSRSRMPAPPACSIDELGRGDD